MEEPQAGEARGNKGSAASREGCGLAKAELRMSSRAWSRLKQLILCDHDVFGEHTVVAQGRGPRRIIHRIRNQGPASP